MVRFSYEKKEIFKDSRLFEFQCPQRWEFLESLDTPGVKHCSECDRNVHKATNKAQLLQFGKEGKCAAYFDYEEDRNGRSNIQRGNHSTKRIKNRIQ